MYSFLCRGTPLEYMVDMLLIHLDDPESSMQVRGGSLSLTSTELSYDFISCYHLFLGCRTAGA